MKANPIMYQFRLFMQPYHSQIIKDAIRIIFIILLIAGSAIGKVIHVPGDQPKIQEGIIAAASGDTVLVAPGLYFENINFSGKNIVVASHYLLNKDSTYIKNTSIMGCVPSNADTASCVVFYSGEDSTAVLQGFTLTLGNGTKWVDPQFPEYIWLGGGGVFSFKSSPTIRDNHIVSNKVTRRSGVNGAQGGGILCYGGNPLIKNNTIISNQADYGAGLVIDYSGAMVKNNIICQNRGGQAYGGAGIWTIGNGPAPIIIENNTIVENSSTGSGVYGGRGGALFVWYSTLTARNNIIWGNTQSQGGPIAEIDGGKANITYSNVEGGFHGQGNINTDPLFSDEDFNLSENSPCVDAGDPNSPLDHDGTRADMGARTYYHLDAPYIRISDYVLDDSLGNNNGKADANETVNLIVTLINTSLDGMGISAALTNDDPDVQIIQDIANFGDLARDQSRANQSNNFSFSVSPDAIPHYSNFTLNITADGGYTNIDSIKLIIGSATILIIDDDEGAVYEQYYTKPLEDMQIFPAMWDISVKGCPTAEELRQCKSVIWFTGDDRNSTLTAEEQLAVADFLDNGGKFMISGQDIGYDLVENGSVEDSTFYANYLHAKYISDTVDADTISFVPGEPLTDGLFFYLGGANNQTRPGVIEAIANAHLIFNWIPGYLGAGLKYEDPILNYRVVYLAFGIEGVDDSSPGMKNTFLSNVLDWFAIETKVDFEDITTGIPSIFHISQNYPNPFNHSTIINYQIPEAAHVEIEIFNLLGQKIKSLVSKYQEKNSYQINWNGDDTYGAKVASGIYIYRMKAGDFLKTKKLLFLK